MTADSAEDKERVNRLGYGAGNGSRTTTGIMYLRRQRMRWRKEMNPRIRRRCLRRLWRKMSPWAASVAQQWADDRSFDAIKRAQEIRYKNGGVGGGQGLGRDAANGGGGEESLYFIPDSDFH